MICHTWSKSKPIVCHLTNKRNKNKKRAYIWVLTVKIPSRSERSHVFLLLLLLLMLVCFCFWKKRKSIKYFSTKSVINFKNFVCLACLLFMFFTFFKVLFSPKLLLFSFLLLVCVFFFSNKFTKHQHIQQWASHLMSCYFVKTTILTKQQTLSSNPEIDLFFLQQI